MFPGTTEDMVLEAINKKMTDTSSVKEDAVKAPKRGNAKKLQTDAYASYLAMHSRLRKIETSFIEPDKTVSPQLRAAVRELLSEHFAIIKDLD